MMPGQPPLVMIIAGSPYIVPLNWWGGIISEHSLEHLVKAIDQQPTVANYITLCQLLTSSNYELVIKYFDHFDGWNKFLAMGHSSLKPPNYHLQWVLLNLLKRTKCTKGATLHVLNWLTLIIKQRHASNFTNASYQIQRWEDARKKQRLISRLCCSTAEQHAPMASFVEPYVQFSQHVLDN